MDLSTYPLWTATVTPFLPDHSIDFPALQNLLQRQGAASNGVILLGSTGEALALSFEEQQSVVEFACSLKLPIPLLVGVGGCRLPQVLRWLDFCEQQAIHGYLMPTPLYTKPGPVGQRQWFETLLSRVQKPCMLYNVPSRTGQDLLIDAISALPFWALKEASGSVATFRKYQQHLPGVALFSGDDSMTPATNAVGGRGLVSVAANIWPAQIKAFVQGELPPAVVCQACDTLFMAPNPVPSKVLLHHKGVISSPALRPPLTHGEITDLAPLLAADEVMTGLCG